MEANENENNPFVSVASSSGSSDFNHNLQNSSNLLSNYQNYGNCRNSNDRTNENSQQNLSNNRHQLLFNHVLLVDAANRQQNQNEEYEELKRLIIFAGIFFLFMIIFVLLKFQVSLDDVFKWSPVVWLIGVIVCGLIMNIFIQLKKFLKRRRAKRLRDQQNLLYSLNLPTSFPCLAPPPHNESCCQCRSQNRASGILFTENVEHGNFPRAQSLLSLSSTFGVTPRTVYTLPSYDQVIRDAKRWIISKTSTEQTSSNAEYQPPPMYTVNDASRLPSNNNICDPVYEELITSSNRNTVGNSYMPDIPPPVYEEPIIRTNQ